MKCDTWQTKLESYVDGELTETELSNLESHLRSCPSCVADALGRVQMKRATQSVGTRYIPTPQFRLRLEQTIKAKTKPTGIFSWFRLPAKLSTARHASVLLTAAVIIVLLVGAADFWMRRWQREQAFTELADMHVATLASANPVDVVSTDRHTVKPWFAGKLPFTFNLPELQSSPYKLVGGRVAYFEHSPGAQLLFEIRKHQLSVFIFQDSSAIPFGSGPTSARKLAFNMETWSEGGLSYLVISDAGATDVHALADLLRTAARS